MENQEKHICENCGKEHDGSYGSGRFCSDHCRRAYCVKQRKAFKCNWPGAKPKEGGWQCKCGQTFLTRRLLRVHRDECEVNKIRKEVIWNKGLTKETDERIKKAC